MNDIDFIRDKLSKEELLCQLSEEASELSHAAHKLRRALNGKNPTPVTREEAFESLLEECADVSNALEALGLNTGMIRMRISRIMVEKASRWVDRVKERAAE